MKKTFFFLILILMVINKSSAQNNLYSLEVQIIELKSNKGEILLQLFDDENKTISNKRATIKNKKCSIIIPNLKRGNYTTGLGRAKTQMRKLIIL
jgi:uncharacterized protein (DUF2141 family)